MAIGFAIAQPNLGDAVAGVVAGKLIRAARIVSGAASSLVFVVAAVVLSVAFPKHCNAAAIFAVEPSLRALSDDVSNKVEIRRCQE